VPGDGAREGAELSGIGVRTEPLPRDRNFCLGGEPGEFVLNHANAADPSFPLEIKNAGMRVLTTRVPELPRPFQGPPLAGRDIAEHGEQPEIANAFANSLDYFDPFGGNPVSCAIGPAALSDVRGEDLPPNVIEIKPLMAFTRSDADRVSRLLDEVLS
jgi:hypothetical protein